MTFLFFAINCTTPFIQKEVAVNQIFVVSSLNAAGTDKITLTITIDANNDARVVRNVANAGPKDVHTVFIVGDSLHSTGGSMDTADIEITSIRLGSQRFWVDFDQTAAKIVNDGGNSFKFFCNSENWKKDISSVPQLTTIGNKIYFSCIQSCLVCELKHFITPGRIVEGGEVYIYANFVSYQ